MDSSKFLPGCLLSLAAVAVLYASWVAFPPVQFAAEARQALDHQQQAFEADQKLAADPAKNAFIDPQLSQFWGRRSLEFRDKSAVSQVTSAMRAFGFLAGEQSAAVADLWNRKDPGLRKAVAEFEQLRPTLKRALSCPFYVLPQANPPDLESDPDNVLAHRAIAQALSAYAEVQLADGKPDQALAATAEIFQLARLLVARRSHSSIDVMVASAIQVTGQETLGYLLQSGRLKPQQLRPWLEVLRTTPFTPEIVLDSMEYELWVGRSFIEHPPKSMQGGKLSYLPGLWQREWRLFQNDYIPVLRASRNHQAVTISWMGSFGLSNWLMGQHSWVTALYMPNYERVFKILEVTRQRQDFLRLYVHLLLERPATLDSKWIGSLNSKAITYRLENGGPSLSYDLDAGLAATLPTSKLSIGRWQTLMGAHWALPVAQ